MSYDIDTIIAEDIDVKNEFNTIFKNLEDGFKGILSVYEKLEKPYLQISENLKEYAKATSESGKEESSPFFSLGKKYETLIDSHKELSHDITDDVVIVLQTLVSKSVLLNEEFKVLNSSVKDVRNLRNKIAKLEVQIEEAHGKGKPDKATKKEAEKQIKQDELDSANTKLKSKKEHFDKTIADFNEERDEMLKKALKKLITAENTQIKAINGIIGGLEKASGEKVAKKKAPVKEEPVEEAPAEEEDTTV